MSHTYRVEKLKKQRREAHSILKFTPPIIKVILAYWRRLGKGPFNIKRKMFLYGDYVFYGLHVVLGT